VPEQLSCSDDESGILFVDGRAPKAVSTRDDHHSYHVYLKGGKILIKVNAGQQLSCTLYTNFGKLL